MDRLMDATATASHNKSIDPAGHQASVSGAARLMRLASHYQTSTSQPDHRREEMEDRLYHQRVALMLLSRNLPCPEKLLEKIKGKSTVRCVLHPKKLLDIIYSIVARFSAGKAQWDQYRILHGPHSALAAGICQRRALRRGKLGAAGVLLSVSTRSSPSTSIIIPHTCPC